MQPDIINKHVLPPSLVVSILSGWIDWTERKRPVFRYLMEIRHKGQIMTCEYSGGILAFLSDAGKARIRSGLHPVPRGVSAVQVAECAKGILSGRSPVYSPGDPADIATVALGWLFLESKPDPAGVIHSLLLDARAGQEPFDYFCQDFGYDTDSRKAFAVWEACQKEWVDMKRVFGDLVPDLEKILEDY